MHVWEVSVTDYVYSWLWLKRRKEIQREVSSWLVSLPWVVSGEALIAGMKRWLSFSVFCLCSAWTHFVYFSFDFTHFNLVRGINTTEDCEAGNPGQRPVFFPLLALHAMRSGNRTTFTGRASSKLVHEDCTWRRNYTWRKVSPHFVLHLSSSSSCSLQKCVSQCIAFNPSLVFSVTQDPLIVGPFRTLSNRHHEWESSLRDHWQTWRNSCSKWGNFEKWNNLLSCCLLDSSRHPSSRSSCSSSWICPRRVEGSWSLPWFSNFCLWAEKNAVWGEEGINTKLFRSRSRSSISCCIHSVVQTIQGIPT